VTRQREERFSDLFRAHHGAVRRYVLRRSWPDAVDDVVAETFLVAWRRLDVVPGDPLPWLFTTARNCLSNHHRGALRGDALLARLRAEPEFPTTDEFDQLEQRRSLLRAFATLNDSERELVMLCDWDGLPPRQIAATIGAGTVQTRARLYRARQKLRTALTDELGDPHPEPTPRRAHDPA
jgi:RNA polymerase sigma-70 factor (ECF subfamily)